MNSELLLQAQQNIFNVLKTQKAALEAVRASKLPLVNKWQIFLSIILPIQIEVLRNLDLGSDQLALAHFNEQYLLHSLQDDRLRELNAQKWAFLLDEAFGLKELREISLEQARSLAQDIVEAMQSESFLLEVDRVMATLAADASMLLRRQKLLTVLMPLQMAVMQEHGFAGEEGYIQAQRALMDYYHDPLIMERVVPAQMMLFKRADLIS
jgi:hypothetical protein